MNQPQVGHLVFVCLSNTKKLKKIPQKGLWLNLSYNPKNRLTLAGLGWVVVVLSKHNLTYSPAHPTNTFSFNM